MSAPLPPPPASLVRPLDDLDSAWHVGGEGARLKAVRAAAERLREPFVNGPRIVSVRTLPLTTLPYPAKYAFWGAAQTLGPFVIMTHRALLVQFFQEGALKNLLFNPSDIDAARATPFFARLAAKFGERVTNALQTRFPPLETRLREHGLSPSDIDYVAFDHFHTQDLRWTIGTADGTKLPRFPRATLLAPENEWQAWDDLHPMQKAWFVADGKRGVRTDHVQFTRGDLALGDGVLLLRTPGHTVGNQTLFVNTASGVWGTSENGTCADNWTPHESRIRGIRKTIADTDVDVVLNANTPELGAAQYTSMILERTLCSRVAAAPAFVQMFASSEVTKSYLAPGVAPTWTFGAITEGNVVLPQARPVAKSTESAIVSGA